MLNVARIGKFSSDRTVLEYARDIWHIGKFESKARGFKPLIRSMPPVKVNEEAVSTSEIIPEPESKQVAD